MPTSPRATPPPTPHSGAPGFGLDAVAMNGALQPSRQIAELASTMGVEVLRFASRRLRAQAEYFDALTQCRTMQELMERQMDFLQRAGSEYTEELGAVMKLAQTTTEPEPTTKQPGA